MLIADAILAPGSNCRIKMFIVVGLDAIVNMFYCCMFYLLHLKAEKAALHVSC